MDDLFRERMARGLADVLPGKEPVSVELLRLLAEGRPVPIERVAAVLERPAADVDAAVRGLANVEFDEEGRIVGCGIMLKPTPHRLVVDGRSLFTWCAFDTLLFSPMLGRPATVESRCAATGAPIRIVVTPTGVERVDPTSVVVSILVPEREAACCDVRSSFCNHVHFFRSADAARAWLDEHRDGAVLSVREAFDLGRRVREHCEGAVA